MLILLRNLRLIIPLIGLVMALLVIVLPSRGQNGPLFVVTYPTEGQVFHPGDVLSVVVAPRTGASLIGVDINSVIGSSHKEPVVPIQVTIPRDKFGPLILYITAASNSQIDEVDRTIVVEPAVAPSSIVVSPQSLLLAMPGSSKVFPLTSDRITVKGSFGDGSQSTLTSSLSTNLLSGNTKVFTVTPAGLVTAVAPGIASLRVTYANLSVLAEVRVNVFPLRGDLDGDGDVDQDDISFLVKSLNTPATGPGDPRDLNGDGKIDALDSRILTTLCSRSHCAVQ